MNKIKKFYSDNPKMFWALSVIGTLIIIWISVSYIQYSNAPSKGNLSKWIQQCESKNGEGLKFGPEIGKCIVQNYNLDEVQFSSNQKKKYIQKYKPFIGFLFGLDITAQREVQIDKYTSRGIRYALAQKHLEKGNNLRKAKEYKKAVEVYNKGIKELKETEGSFYKKALAELYINLGQAYQLGGEEVFNFPLDTALEKVRNAWKVASSSVWVRTELGRFHFINKNYEQGKKKLDSAIKLGEKYLKTKNTATSTDDTRLNILLQNKKGIKNSLADAYILKSGICARQMLDFYGRKHETTLDECAINNYQRGKKLNPKNSKLQDLEKMINFLK